MTRKTKHDVSLEIVWAKNDVLRTGDGRAFIYPSGRCEEVVHRMRYGAELGESCLYSSLERIHAAYVMTAFRDIIHMTREKREEWVRLARLAITQERQAAELRRMAKNNEDAK